MNIAAKPTRGTLAGLRIDGWTTEDMFRFVKHAGREMFQACPDRDFRRMWIQKRDGSLSPRYRSIDDWSPTDPGSLAGCQYAYLTSKNVSCFIIVDCDQTGRPDDGTGNDLERINPLVFSRIITLSERGFPPAWIGINPLSGKCQLIWYIEPVYTATGTTSPNSRLLAALQAELRAFFQADPHFNHGISRWPFYLGPDLTAYRWHIQSHGVSNMRKMITTVRAIMGKEAASKRKTTDQYPSGRARIEAARKAAAQRKLLADLDKTLLSADEATSDLVDGVRVRWIAPGLAGRDETAFRHALKIAHSLHDSGKTMKDHLIIDAYEYAYNVAQAIGGGGREPEMPPMRDRQTMARRVRGYVVSGTANRPSSRVLVRQTTAGRKALATMGRKGGKKAAERWKTDPNGEYARQQRTNLAAANQKRAVAAQGLRGEILATYATTVAQTGTAPKAREIAADLGCHRTTVAKHLSALRRSGILDT